jgi:AcrR family transcriptional regulator
MRADAEDNRRRLLDAASAVFAERGVDAPLRLIATRAGLGAGTLYRHFPDRDAVILGLGDVLGARYGAVAMAAASAPTGWDGIVAYLEGVTAMYIDMPWMIAVLPRFRALRPPDDSGERAALWVIERAWAEGSLRDDIGPTDLAFVPSLMSALVHLPEPLRSVVMARQRDIILDGLRPVGAERPVLGGTPLPLDDFRVRIGRTAETPDAAGVS